MHYIRYRYRHPKKEVFERYGELDIQRLRTDESGAIAFEFGPQITTSEYRRQHERYWYEP